MPMAHINKQMHKQNVHAFRPKEILLQTRSVEECPPQRNKSLHGTQISSFWVSITFQSANCSNKHLQVTCQSKQDTTEEAIFLDCHTEGFLQGFTNPKTWNPFVSFHEKWLGTRHILALLQDDDCLEERRIKHGEEALIQAPCFLVIWKKLNSSD
jgi:hypothetical protein